MSHFILPGSFAVDGETVTAGVHTGVSEWDIRNLRYIRANFVEAVGAQPELTVLELLSRVYDNSTGCVAQGTFKENAGD